MNKYIIINIINKLRILARYFKNDICVKTD